MKYANPYTSYYVKFGKRYTLDEPAWADLSLSIGFSILM